LDSFFDQYGQIVDIIIELALSNILLMTIVNDMVPIIFVIPTTNCAVIVLAFGLSDKLNKINFTIFSREVCFKLSLDFFLWSS